MRKAGVSVLVATAMSLLALLVLPLGEGSATAQNWEVVGDRGIKVALDRRDDQGRAYIRLQAPRMGEYYYAVDCSQGLVHEYDRFKKAWKEPYRVDDFDPEHLRVFQVYATTAHTYACK